MTSSLADPVTVPPVPPNAPTSGSRKHTALIVGTAVLAGFAAVAVAAPQPVDGLLLSTAVSIGAVPADQLVATGPALPLTGVTVSNDGKTITGVRFGQAGSGTSGPYSVTIYSQDGHWTAAAHRVNTRTGFFSTTSDGIAGRGSCLTGNTAVTATGQVPAAATGKALTNAAGQAIPVLNVPVTSDC